MWKSTPWQTVRNKGEFFQRGDSGQPLKMEIDNEIRMKYGQPLNTLPGYSLLFSLIPCHVPLF